MIKESKFQSDLIHELKETLPGCIVLKNDANYIQGFPDLSVYYKDRYALLECKRSDEASHRPNQDYYIQKVKSMGGFARFIHPGNKKEVLDELQQTFGSDRPACISGSE